MIVIEKKYFNNLFNYLYKKETKEKQETNS